jgi:hypothetical protein
MMTTDRVLGLLGPPLIAAALVLGLRALPAEVLRFLTAWILASVPIGIVLGHCALGEDHGGI